MAENIKLYEFNRLALQYYQFLVDDFGFLIKKPEDWSISLETETSKVLLLVEHETLLTVALEPIGEEANKLLRQNILPKGFEVVIVSMCLDSDLNYKVRRLENKSLAHDIPIEMERRAELLKKYCKKMLKGDFSDWASIEKCISMRAYEFLNL